MYLYQMKKEGMLYPTQMLLNIYSCDVQHPPHLSYEPHDDYGERLVQFPPSNVLSLHSRGYHGFQHG